MRDRACLGSGYFQSRTSSQTVVGLEPHPRRGAHEYCGLRANGKRAVTLRIGGALHRYGKVFCLRVFGLSDPQGARPDHQPNLRRFECCLRVQGQDHGSKSALADRLHPSQSHRLGLVLSQHDPRQRYPIHYCLETLHHDADGGCDRHAGSGSASFRLRPDYDDCIFDKPMSAVDRLISLFSRNR